jgi:hypothetical protein
MAATSPAVRVRIMIPISHVGIAGANPRSLASRVSSEPSGGRASPVDAGRNVTPSMHGQLDDEIPLWLMVGAAFIFPFPFPFGALILGASKLGQ